MGTPLLRRGLEGLRNLLAGDGMGQVLVQVQAVEFRVRRRRGVLLEMEEILLTDDQ